MPSSRHHLRDLRCHPLHLGRRVRQIAGEQPRTSLAANEQRRVPGCVPRRRHEQQPPVAGDVGGRRERSDRLRRRSRPASARAPRATAAADSRARDRERPSPASTRAGARAPGMREGVDAADVIRVEMGEHDRADADRLDADRRELRRDLVRARASSNRESRKKGCQRGNHPGAAARAVWPVSKRQTAADRVLDQEGVDGHRLVAPLVDHVTADPSLCPPWRGRDP